MFPLLGCIKTTCLLLSVLQYTALALKDLILCCLRVLSRRSHERGRQLFPSWSLLVGLGHHTIPPLIASRPPDLQLRDCISAWNLRNHDGEISMHVLSRSFSEPAK